MKNFSLFFFFLQILLLQAQTPWQPIHLNSKFHYSKSNDPNVFITNSLWVDSTKVMGGNMVYFLNKIIVAHDYFPDTTVYDQPQFLKTKMVDIGGGNFSFQDTGAFSIQTLSSIGQSWLFDASLNIQATVSNIQAQTILNQPDSIKLILLSNGDSIILSRQHGIVYFPDYQYHQGNYRLTGIENPSLGAQVLNFWEIYNYNIGDIFEFEAFEGNIGLTNRRTFKWEILARDTVNDTLMYQVYQQLITEQATGWWPATISYSSDTVWAKYIETEDVSNSYPLEYKKYGFRFATPPSQLVMSIAPLPYHTAIKDCGQDTTWQCEYKRTLNMAYDSLSYPYINTRDFSVLYLDYRLGKGIGDYQYSFSFFESVFSKNMIGYIKNGDTVGVVHEDDYFTDIHSAQSLRGIKIYPNPVKENIHLTFEEAGKPEIIVFSSIGQRIESTIQPISISEYQINIQDLPSGIYFLRVSQNNKWGTFKILKE